VSSKARGILFSSALLTIFVLATPSGCAAQAGRPTEGFARADDGTQLFYQKWGTGEQTVIIPGAFLLGGDFARLALGRTLIMYDMRNRGRSSKVTAPARMTVQDDVRDLEAIREHFGVERFSTVGYSYLGKMVMLYALAYPGRLERAVQMGPVPMRWNTQFPADEMNRDDAQIVDGAGWSDLQRLRKEGYDKSHPREFCEKEWAVTRVRLVGNQANVAKLGPGPCQYQNEWPVNLGVQFQASFASIQRANVDAVQAEKITIPVLTIHGTKDRNAPYGSGKEWASRLPNARLIPLPGAAHNSWIDEPRVIDWIDEFLGGEWPAPSRQVGK
jgi:pimeloyl-ACP methyl ester carboxylesterase